MSNLRLSNLTQNKFEDIPLVLVTAELERSMMHPLYGQKTQIRTHLKSVFVKCRTLMENIKTLPWYVLVLMFQKSYF